MKSDAVRKRLSCFREALVLFLTLALLPFALVWVGYSLPAAVLAVFAYRFFNLWLPLGPAAVGLYHLQRRAPEGSNR